MFDTQAAAQLPLGLGLGDGDGDGEGDVGVGVGDGVGGGVGEVLLANATVYVLNAHGFCGTLLHSLDRLPLLSRGLHCRSRLTDQNVNRLIPEFSAKLSTVWKSAW